jgi:serine/threonine-protein kinase
MRSQRIRIQRLQQIAVGGMAVLFLAEQPDGTNLVIRELHPKLRWRLRSHLRFRRGARIRDLVSPHPNIVFSVEYGYSRLVPYEIIEYVPGQNLHELIGRRDECIVRNNLEVLRQASNAIAHMHDAGYIHLDVKAENFVLDKRAYEQDRVLVKLTDFDLSRRISASFDARRAGTASYMAPELLRKGSVGIEADIFAFGVLAYYLVTRRKPFSGFTLDEMRRQQLSQSYLVPEPIRLAPEIAPKLSWIIMKCLEKDPAQRFPSMAYLRRELDRF